MTLEQLTTVHLNWTTMILSGLVVIGILISLPGRFWTLVHALMWICIGAGFAMFIYYLWHVLPEDRATRIGVLGVLTMGEGLIVGKFATTMRQVRDKSSSQSSSKV